MGSVRKKRPDDIISHRLLAAIMLAHYAMPVRDASP
jgi:hypothetical protein